MRNATYGKGCTQENGGVVHRARAEGVAGLGAPAVGLVEALGAAHGHKAENCTVKAHTFSSGLRAETGRA